MAQNDMNIANQGFPGFRADLNDALGALVSNNSGATAPATTFAHQYWVDTSANPSVLKIRNADNDAFITIGTINQTADTFTLTAAVSTTTLNTSGQVVFNDAGADVDFRVEGDTDANLLFVDASTDRVGIGTATPSASLHINSTGAMIIPVGTTAQRPATPAKGMLRLNTDTGDVVEVFNGTAFVAVGEQVVPLVVDFLVVAGGGAGGGFNAGGGGGAGGYREFSAQTLTVLTNFTVTVGAGASGTGSAVQGSNGSNSVFSTTTSNGGGGGGSNQLASSSANAPGVSGGSGGGGSFSSGAGGSATSGQGNAGGVGSAGQGAAGGGGGAFAAGDTPAGGDGAAGGAGKASSISGTSVTRAGGGGGGSAGGAAAGGAGGAGGGGAGAAGVGVNGSVGAVNTGGGGGGAGINNSSSGNGGSGIVIIKYPDSFTISNPGGGLTLSTATAGGFSVTTVTAGTGNVSFA